MKKRIITSILSFAMLFANVSYVSANTDAEQSQIKNIIYMIPDGGGMAPFYLADYVKQAGGLTDEYPNATPVEKGEMYIKQYLVGSETTHSANNSVTDSAASGTALSSGYKTNNSYIGVTPDYLPRASLLDASQAAGKNTGIVVTYEISNATPAAFGAHSMSRYNTLEIGEQMTNRGIDVVFSYPYSAYSGEEWFEDKAFEERGYEVIKTREQLEAMEPGDRVWGKLSPAYYDINRNAETPNLSELTEAAIKALDDGNENGFFLMVEGSAVDGGGHDSNAIRMVSEWLAFDEACKVAIEFAKKRTDTIVVIMPDHDTGGIRNGNTYAKSSLESLVEDIQNGTNPTSITWEGNGNHTSRNGGIFMYVPEGVAYPDGIDVSRVNQVAAEFESDFRESSANRIDNTAMAPYLAGFIGVDLNSLTEELFVDVTEKGQYDYDKEIFTFTNDVGEDVEVKANVSSATVGGSSYDLDGKIVLYLNSRFYVPQTLMNAESREASISIHADFNEKIVRVNGITKDSMADISLLVTKPDAESDGKIDKSEVVFAKQAKSSKWGEYSFAFGVRNAQVGDYNYRTRINDDESYEDYNFSFKNMDIQKDGQTVSKMSELNAGDSIELVLSGYDSSYDGNACICQYDEDGRLITVSSLPVQGEAVSGVAFGKAVDSKIPAIVADETKSIKALYWDYEFVPITGSYTVK